MRFLWPWFCLPLLSRFNYPLVRFLLTGLLFVVATFVIGIAIIGYQTLPVQTRTSLPTKPDPAAQKFTVVVATDVNDPSLRYGIVVDLGSSGSRVFVYFWPPHDGATSELLNIQQMRDRNADQVVKKISPGISTLKDTPANASVYLAPLLKYAAEHIPRSKHKETPLYVMATAGLRMLSKGEQEAILDNLRVDIPMRFDFLFAATHAEVISGRQEGVYLWIAINHALGKFDHTLGDDDLDMVYLPNVKRGMHVRKRSVGVIDMGGASLQIAYEVPDASDVLEHQLTKFNLGCTNSDTHHAYSIYVTTFLGYGGNAARTRYEHSLVERHLQAEMVPTNSTTGMTLSDAAANVIDDPCLAVNKIKKMTHAERQYRLRGTGDYLRCKTHLVPLLNQSVACEKRPCSMNGVFQPEIKFQRSTFYGFSELFYSSEDVLRLGGPYHYKTFEKAAKARLPWEEMVKLNKGSIFIITETQFAIQSQDHCATEWSILEAWYRKNYYPKATHHRLMTECFKAAWVTTVLHEGFGFPKSYQRLTTAQLLYGREVQWTLGAILYKTRFYPLRYMKTSPPQHAHQFTELRQVTYLLVVFCFGVVMAAILGFIWHLRVGRRASLRRVPTMSYFMTEQSQPEEGVLLRDTHYYYP